MHRVVALVIAVVLSAGTTNAAHAAVTPETGTIVVHLLAPDGSRLNVGNARVDLTLPRVPLRSNTTDDHGAATFTGVPTTTTGHYVHVTPPPQPGYDRRTRGEATRVGVRAGQTTTVDVTLPIGATIEGTLIGPGASPPSGVAIEVYGERTGTSVSTTSNARGRYFISGLPTDIYVVTVYAGADAVPTVWRQDVVAQRAGTTASHIFSPKHYIHSTYDLQIVLRGADPDLSAFSWQGATVIATSVTTGESFTEQVDASSSAQKVAQFMMPSGRYTVEVIVPASATVSAGHYWFAGTESAPVTDAAAAAPIRVAYGAVATEFIASL